ncbi:hypothetical protein ACVPOS_07535 [Staphylococcus aureus]
MTHQLGFDVSWVSGSYMQAPWSIVMSVALYFIMIKVMPPEINTIEGGNI